jgi:NADPH:quinone reductase-like Zn-dependent oxidoreductase
VALVTRENSDDLVTIRELIEAGMVTPVIDRTYPFAAAADAVRHVAAGHTRGKVLITTRA